MVGRTLFLLNERQVHRANSTSHSDGGGGCYGRKQASFTYPQKPECLENRIAVLWLHPSSDDKTSKLALGSISQIWNIVEFTCLQIYFIFVSLPSSRVYTLLTGLYFLYTLLFPNTFKRIHNRSPNSIF